MITLEKGQQLLGHDAIGIRDFIKYIVCDATPPQSVLKRLNVKTTNEYTKIIKLLVDNGYVEVETQNFRGDVFNSYEATPLGRELCRAKCMSRMSRDKANQLYEQIISRVAEVNNNPYYLYKITKFVLFGSFITNKETLGDIDISYKLEPKVNKNIAKQNRERAYQNNCYHLLYSSSYGEIEIEKFIKNRSPKIHIIPFSHLKEMKVQTKSIKL